MKTWQEKSKEAMKTDWKMIWQGCLVRDLETDYWTRVIQVYAPDWDVWNFTGVQSALKSHSGSQKDVYLDLTDSATVGCIQREVEKACDYYELELSWEKAHRPDNWTISIGKNGSVFYGVHGRSIAEGTLGEMALDALVWLRGYEE